MVNLCNVCLFCFYFYLLSIHCIDCWLIYAMYAFFWFYFYLLSIHCIDWWFIYAMYAFFGFIYLINNFCFYLPSFARVLWTAIKFVTWLCYCGLLFSLSNKWTLWNSSISFFLFCVCVCVCICIYIYVWQVCSGLNMKKVDCICTVDVVCLLSYSAHQP